MPERPSLVVVGDAYAFTWDGIAKAQVDRITETRDGIHAEVVIHSDLFGFIHAARLNLMSSQSRATMARALKEREELDWGAMLEALCFLTVERYREGEPIDELDAVDIDERPRWLLYPYVEYGGPTVLFADGASCKSVLAMCMAYSVATGDAVLGKAMGGKKNVMYLDWETDRYTQATRLRAIASARFGDCPRLQYRRMTSSLAESAARIRADVAKHQIGFVVVDSVGFASSGPLIDDVTARQFMAALNSIPCPCLGVHHIPKGDLANKDKPFGSVYYSNGPRNTWGLKVVRTEGSELVVVSFKHQKSNNGVFLPQHAFEVKFTNVGAEEDRKLVGIRVKRVAVAGVPEFEKDLPLRQRILNSLNGSGQTYQELAEALEANVGTVKKDLTRLKGEGKVIALPGSRWGRPASQQELPA